MSDEIDSPVLRADQQVRLAGAVIVRVDDATFGSLRPWLDLPSKPTRASAAELAKPGRDGKPRPRPVMTAWVSGRRARTGTPPLAPLSIPVLAVPAHWPAAAGDPAIDLADVDTVKVGPELSAPVNVEGTNLAFHVPGAESAEAERPPVVVLMAHLDALGRAADTGGKRYPGADDNASGVIATLLAAIGSRPSGRTGVVLAFPDGEEWGLLGSRALVAPLTKRFDVQAVVNVDSVGRATTQPTYVLGVSKHPELAEAVQRRLDAAGLERGTNIDKYAYAHGSDHWPFHEAGIPAVSLWASDYAVMNTADDTPDKVEIDGIVEVAQALRALIDADLDDLR